MNIGMLFWLMLVAFFAGGVFGSCTRHNWWQYEAVRAGHAEFYLDKDHNRQWRWLSK
jgi:hypothetical protein